jgi:hypothetical protein
MTGSRDDVLEPSVYDLARESARVEGEATLVQGQMLLFVRDEAVKLRDRSYFFLETSTRIEVFYGFPRKWDQH